MNPMHFILIAILLLTTLSSVQAAPPSYQNAVLADNPIVYYQFNESIGNAINHGTLGAPFDMTHNGTPIRGAATLGGDTGVAFDSFDDYLQSVDLAPASLTGNPSFTAETMIFVPLGGTAGLWAPLLQWGESVGLPSPTMESVYFSFSNADPDEIFAGFYNGGLQTVDPVGNRSHCSLSPSVSECVALPASRHSRSRATSGLCTTSATRARAAALKSATLRPTRRGCLRIRTTSV